MLDSNEFLNCKGTVNSLIKFENLNKNNDGQIQIMNSLFKNNSVLD